MKRVVLLIVLLALLRSSAAQCPAVCACTGLTATVDCRPEIAGIGFQFTSIPTGGPANTRILIMTGNAISSLPPGNFSEYPELTTLVLNDNLLNDVPILDIPQLTNLTLDGNPFTDLQDGAFSNLTSLEHLYIRRTPLKSLRADTFSGAVVTHLYIDDNPFTELPSDLLMFLPQLELLSLTETPLQTLPDDLFSPLDPTIARLMLLDNPWSCDCDLGWLGEFLANYSDVLLMSSETVCLWPPAHVNTPLADVPLSQFTCFAPEVIQSPVNTTVLSNLTLTIPCRINSAPFPEVVWVKDGVLFNTTARVGLEDTYSAALFFESLEISDSGAYQCILTNGEGSAASGEGTVTVLEHTCFDGVHTEYHETDVDCGGPYCKQCNITEGCRADRDCGEEYICLHAHQLPSMLQYISPLDPQAFTCGLPTVPPALLKAIIQEQLPLGSLGVNGSLDSTELSSGLQLLLATELGVPMNTITNLAVNSVRKPTRPLLQVLFSMPKTRSGSTGRAKLRQLVDQGELKVTAKISELANTYQIRLNF